MILFVCSSGPDSFAIGSRDLISRSYWRCRSARGRIGKPKSRPVAKAIVCRWQDFHLFRLKCRRPVPRPSKKGKCLASAESFRLDIIPGHWNNIQLDCLKKIDYQRKYRYARVQPLCGWEDKFIINPAWKCRVNHLQPLQGCWLLHPYYLTDDDCKKRIPEGFNLNNSGWNPEVWRQ